MVKRRKTIALDEDIITSISGIAKRKGMSLSNYLRRLLTAAINVEKHGINPEQALYEQVILKYMKTAGLSFNPIEDISNTNKAVWETVGKRLGLILKIRELDKVRALKDTILLLLSGIGEITIEERRDIVKITCITTKTEKKVLEALEALISNLASQLDIKLNTHIDEGIMIIEFKK